MFNDHGREIWSIVRATIRKKSASSFRWWNSHFEDDASFGARKWLHRPRIRPSIDPARQTLSLSVSSLWSKHWSNKNWCFCLPFVPAVTVCAYPSTLTPCLYASAWSTFNFRLEEIKERSRESRLLFLLCDDPFFIVSFTGEIEREKESRSELQSEMLFG